MTSSSAIPSFLSSSPELVPLLPGELEFFSQLKSHISLVNRYEDGKLQEKARQLVPWQEMTTNSIKKLLSLRKSDPKINVESRDLLLLELLRWFKNNFFTWFDAPTCSKCNSKMSLSSSPPPTPEEALWLCSRVELFTCPSTNCHEQFRFCRFNHPEKLLSTRTGRCGEWANCFTMLCRALNFDARFVVDSTDHVWTEVYSPSQGRWLHCDPGEDFCDKPMLYEVGWGKRLTLCVAFGRFEVQDVSWRYSNDHLAMRQRRASLFREDWIIKVLGKVNTNLQLALSEDQRSELRLRQLGELVEFIRVPNQRISLKPEEHCGRSSGSLAWRLARGEVQQEEEVGYVFELTPGCCLVYSAATDRYKINGCVIDKWQSGVFRCRNVRRKVEADWRKVYLARTPDSSSDQTGIIVWKIDLTKCSGWTGLSVRVSGAVFASGLLRVAVYSNGERRVEVPVNERVTIARDQLVMQGEVVFLEAQLSGGSGDVGWQHAQLFRADVDADDGSGLELRVLMD